MDEVIIDHLDPEMIEIELPSTPSETEPEMENVVMDDHSYATMLVVSELSSFFEINGLPSSTSTPQKNDSGEDCSGEMCIGDLEVSSPTSHHANLCPDDLLSSTSPSTSDAVVPSERDLKTLPNANDTPATLKHGDNFSSLASTFIACNLLLAGFETFEKIQLWPEAEENNDEAYFNDVPAPASPSGQLLEILQQQVQPSPKSEGSEHQEAPQAEEKNDVDDEDEKGSTCDTLLNFISEADVPTSGLFSCESVDDCFDQVEDEPNPRPIAESSAESPAVSADIDRSDEDYPKFEMKKQFDVVLKELNAFFEISRSDVAGDCSSSSPERCTDETKLTEGNGSECNEYLSSPKVGHPRDSSSEDFEKESRVEMCVDDPELPCPTVVGNGEQEVPRCSDLHQETSMDTDGTHTELPEMEPKGKMWSPSFLCHPHPEQQNHRQPEPVRRLEPLKTCKRPIRVGLSKNAKIKRLY